MGSHDIFTFLAYRISQRNKTVAADLLEWYDSDIVLNDVLVHPQAYSQAWSTAHKGRKTRDGSIHSVYLEFGYLTPLEKLEADGAVAGYFSNHQMREDVNMDDPTVKTIRNQKLAWVAEICNSIIDVRNLQDDGRSLFSQRFIARPGLLVNPCYDEKRIQVAAHMIMNTVLEGAANGFIRPRNGSNQGRFFSNMTLAERLKAICYTLRRSKRAFDHVHAKGHPKAIELIYQPDAYLQHGKALEDTPTEYAVNQNTAADELGGQLTDERHGGTATANSTNSSAHAQRMPVQEGGKRASRKDKNAAAQQDVREAADRPAKRGKKRKRAEASAPQVNTGSTPDDARPQPAASSSAYPPSVQHLINIGYSFRWTRNEGNYAVTTEFPSRKTTRERIYETITAELPEGYEEAEAEEEESIPSTSSPLSSLRGSTPELSDTEPVHRESAALPKLSFSGSLGALEAPGAELIDHQEGGEEHGDVEPSASSSPLSSLKSPTPELSDDDAFYGTSKRASQRAASAGTRHATDATRRKDERLRIWKTIPSLDQQEPSEEDQHRTPLSRIRDILNPRTLEQKHSSWKSPK